MCAKSQRAAHCKCCFVFPFYYFLLRSSPLFSSLLGYYGQCPHTNGKGEGAELSMAAPQVGASPCTESHNVGKAACLHGKGGSGGGLPSELRLHHFTEAKSWKLL